jgi:SOS response regulatory protein OraA/RecX
MRLSNLAADEVVVDSRPWYIRARDWLADSAVVNAATAVRDWSVAEAQQAIQDLYNAGIDFHNTRDELLSLQSTANGNADLQAEYDGLMSRGNLIDSTITTAVNSVQAIAQWIKENTGVDISSAGPPAGLQGLGFIQVVPAAIIGGVVAATALAVAWIVDARSAITRIRALQEAGLSPDQIAAALKQQGGLTGAVSSVTGLLVVGGLLLAGIYFAPQLKRLLK